MKGEKKKEAVAKLRGVVRCSFHQRAAACSGADKKGRERLPQKERAKDIPSGKNFSTEMRRVLQRGEREEVRNKGKKGTSRLPKRKKRYLKKNKKKKPHPVPKGRKENTCHAAEEEKRAITEGEKKRVASSILGEGEKKKLALDIRSVNGGRISVGGGRGTL